MRDLFLARQPIYDAELNLHAYEILYRSGEENCAVLEGGVTDAQATSQVILNAFVELGFDRVAGDRRVFVNLSESLLTSRELELPKDRVVLEVLENTRPTAKVLAALRRFKEDGYVVALDDFEWNDASSLLVELADIVKLDVAHLGTAGTKAHLEKLSPYRVKLLAEKVETQEEFEIYRAMGFDYYQGYFFAKPNIICGRGMSGSRLSTMGLLAALQHKDVDIGELDRRIRQDVVLSYRLLRYINSPFFGLPTHVESVRQAIMLLGTRSLRNWITLTALSGIDDKPIELFAMALARAKSCELYAAALGFRDTETFFTVGLFSLLDAMMDRPLSELLEELPLCSDVKDAILYEDGLFGRVLAATKAHEQGDWLRAAELLDEPGLDLRHAYLDAIHWADDVIASMHPS